MKNKYLNLLKVGTLAVCLGGLLFLVADHPNVAEAQQVIGGFFNPLPVVNSKVAPGTNSHFGVTSNGYYPIAITGGDIVTNFAAKADVSGFRDISIQFSGQANVSVGAVASQTVIATVYRSITGGSSTNSTGTGLYFDTLGTITLAATSSTAGPWTVISNYCNNISPLAGVQTVYVGKLDATALTNGVSFTNYIVTIGGK